ncbi:MAG: hypothetical protein WCL53_07510 [Chloroflexota bacterium]
MAKLYDPDLNGQLHLRDSLVLFVDLLGTKAQSAKSAADQEKHLNDLNSALDAALKRSFSDDDVDDWFHAIAFTDNIALGCPIQPGSDGENELSVVLNAATFFQWGMVERGLFFRGGLALGKASFSNRFAFGPALVEAYKLESTKAKWGRILISPGLRPMIKNQMLNYRKGGLGPPHTESIYIADDAMFLNYLDLLAADGEEHLGLPRHRDVLLNALRHFRRNQKIREKYLWATAYHNYFCRQHGMDEYRISGWSGTEKYEDAFRQLQIRRPAP